MINSAVDFGWTGIRPKEKTKNSRTGRTQHNMRPKFSGNKKKSLDVLAGSTPPIVGRQKRMPSWSYLCRLVAGLELIPYQLRTALSDWGCKIVTGPTIPSVIPDWQEQVDPKSYENQPVERSSFFRVLQQLRTKNWWLTTSSKEPIQPKTIFMPEFAWDWHGFIREGNQTRELIPDLNTPPGPVTVDHFEVEYLNESDPERVVLHEVGHAVDDMLGPGSDAGHGFMSESWGFTQAYNADVRRITDLGEYEFFSYYLPRPDNPNDVFAEARKEAFAESFARLLARNGDPVEKARFMALFPRVCRYIDEHVLNPWREKTERANQTVQSNVSRRD